MLYEAIDASLVRVDGTLSACVTFYYQALEDRGRDISAEAAEDEAVKIELSAFEEKDSVPIQEKDRNPSPAASSSSGPDPVEIAPEPADQDPRPEASEQAVGIATAESVPTDPERYSPVSENTELPPSTDEASEDKETIPLV